MVTTVDEGKGLVKVYWADIRKRVAKVEPKFAKIVDELSPDKTFPIYLAYYPYGALIGDSQSLFIPQTDSSQHRLTDNSVPKEVLKHLGYGKQTSPLGMLIEKNIEYFIDLPEEKITIPWLVYSPGTFFSLADILGKRNNRVYEPNGVLLMTSGSRSSFMLPNIGCSVHHANLQRDFNVQSSSPKSLYEHWNIFKEIINSRILNSSWRSCLLFFSEKWITMLQKDHAWLKLKAYLHELAWNRFEYERNRVYYDIAFSVIQKKRNLKPNPYLVDTARHLFTTALGAAPGYAPTCDEETLPLNEIQNAFINSYGLKKYYTNVMHPAHYNFETDKHPIYYSLQHPSTFVFSPKSRKVSSTLLEMRELEHIMRIFIDELSRDNSMCSDTIINDISKTIRLDYFHNKIDRHKIIMSSEEVLNLDDRFLQSNHHVKISNARFASDAPFLRGCISIRTKKITVNQQG